MPSGAAGPVSRHLTRLLSRKDSSPRAEETLRFAAQLPPRERGLGARRQSAPAAASDQPPDRGAAERKATAPGTLAGLERGVSPERASVGSHAGELSSVAHTDTDIYTNV